MPERDAEADGLGLAAAIGLLRDELLAARAAGAASDIQLPVQSMTVVLTVTATRSADGKAGFKVPIVDLELGADACRVRARRRGLRMRMFWRPCAGNSARSPCLLCSSSAPGYGCMLWRYDVCLRWSFRPGLFQGCGLAHARGARGS
ncbi:MAG: trypco2 family protein [Micromonosporaceae bacterium]